MMVVTPPAAAAWLADASVSRWPAPAWRDQSAAAIDHVGAFRHAAGADALLGFADHAVGNQQVADDIEVARRIDDPGVGEQDRAAVR